MTIENLVQDFLSYYKIRGFKHQGLIVKKNALLFFTAYLREKVEYYRTGRFEKPYKSRSGKLSPIIFKLNP